MYMTIKVADEHLDGSISFNIAFNTSGYQHYLFDRNEPAILFDEMSSNLHFLNVFNYFANLFSPLKLSQFETQNQCVLTHSLSCPSIIIPKEKVVEAINLVCKKDSKFFDLTNANHQKIRADLMTYQASLIQSTAKAFFEPNKMTPNQKAHVRESRPCWNSLR